MAAKVEVKVLPHELAVLINGLPHLLLRRNDLGGIQSYYKTTGVRDPIYFIEFTTARGLIVADYNDRKLWERILAALRDSKLFDNMLGAQSLPGSA